MHILSLFKKRKGKSIPVCFLSFFKDEGNQTQDNIKTFLLNCIKNNITNLSELFHEYVRIYNGFYKFDFLLTKAIEYNRYELLEVFCQYKDPFKKNYNCLSLCLNRNKAEYRKYLLTKVSKNRKKNVKIIQNLLNTFYWRNDEYRLTVFNELNEAFNFTEKELTPLLRDCFYITETYIDYQFMINLIDKGANKFDCDIIYKFMKDSFRCFKIEKLNMMKYMFKDVTNKNIKKVMSKEEYGEFEYGLKTTKNKCIIEYFKDKGIDIEAPDS